MSLVQILDRLEHHYGVLRSREPSDPYQLVLWANCGYPPSDDNCRQGFQMLKREIGLAPKDILTAGNADLARVLRAGGIVPQLRATRLKEIARVVEEDYGGSLDSVLQGPDSERRKALKRFPTIGDPGADKILLFTGHPIPAVPSNCIHVPLRLGIGNEGPSYRASYRSIREVLEAELSPDVQGLQRAYLLLKHHGHACCKRSTPLCAECPVSALCAYFQKAGTATRRRV